MLEETIKANLNLHVSVDCAVFGFEFGKLNVLLIERNMQFEGNEFKDLKLPGDLVLIDEDLDTAASRVLKELTGLDNIYLKQFAAIGSPDRLKRQPRDLEWLRAIGHPQEVVVTIVYYALINIDHENAANFKLQSNARWYAVSDIHELAFDHLAVLQQALSALRKEFRLNPIAYELLPPKFTLGQLQQLYEVILGTQLDKRNFRKKVSNMTYITPVNEKQVGVSHKPACYYCFSRRMYEKTNKDAL